MWRSTLMITSPPRPPSPPSGPPAATYFSRWNETTPLPPAPDLTVILAVSIKLGIFTSWVHGRAMAAPTIGPCGADESAPYSPHSCRERIHALRRFAWRQTAWKEKAPNGIPSEAFSITNKLAYCAISTIETCLRSLPSRSNLTLPSLRANRVSSLPLPTLTPG